MLWADFLLLVLLMWCCAKSRAACTPWESLRFDGISFGLLVSSLMWEKEKERKTHLQKSMSRIQDLSRSFPGYGDLSTYLLF